MARAKYILSITLFALLRLRDRLLGPIYRLTIRCQHGRRGWQGCDQCSLWNEIHTGYLRHQSTDVWTDTRYFNRKLP